MAENEWINKENIMCLLVIFKSVGRQILLKFAFLISFPNLVWW